MERAASHMFTRVFSPTLESIPEHVEVSFAIAKFDRLSLRAPCLESFPGRNHRKLDCFASLRLPRPQWQAMSPKTPHSSPRRTDRKSRASASGGTASAGVHRVSDVSAEVIDKVRARFLPLEPRVSDSKMMASSKPVKRLRTQSVSERISQYEKKAQKLNPVASAPDLKFYVSNSSVTPHRPLEKPPPEVPQSRDKIDNKHGFSPHKDTISSSHIVLMMITVGVLVMIGNFLTST